MRGSDKSSTGRDREIAGRVSDETVLTGRGAVAPPLTDYTKGCTPVAPPLTDHTKGCTPVAPPLTDHTKGRSPVAPPLTDPGPGRIVHHSAGSGSV
jgi:hypothetical protein